MIKAFVLLVPALALSACAAQQPPTMTPLERATTEFVDAYSAAVQEAQRLHVQGLAPCDASLMIGLTADESGELGVSAKPMQVPIGIMADHARSEGVTNTATMDFKSDTCAKAAKMPQMMVAPAK